MRPSYPYDPDHHEPGSVAAQGGCTYHAQGDAPGDCTGEAVVSFEDAEGRWQSGCQAALEALVERGEIHPLGEKA